VSVSDLIARLVAGRDDATLERWFGLFPVQWVLFRLMAARFSCEAAEGFAGVVAYELLRPATGGGSRWWTLDVFGVAAVAAPAASGVAAAGAVVHVPVADFVRAAAGLIDPAEPLLAGRARFEGDLGLGVRLPEMFGAPTPRV
jgi:hypothetical protein